MLPGSLLHRVTSQIRLCHAGSTVGTAADIAVAILFSQTVAAGSPDLAPGPSYAAIILIGIYSISFGFGWGPIGWLVPSEVHDLNTRSAGQSITVFTQLMSGAIVTQVFLVSPHAPLAVHVLPSDPCLRTASHALLGSSHLPCSFL